MSLSFVVDNKDNKESLSPAMPSLSLKEVLCLLLLNVTIAGHTGMLSVPPSLGTVLNKQHLSDREARPCYRQSQTTPKFQQLIIRVNFSLMPHVHQWPATALI